MNEGCQVSDVPTTWLLTREADDARVDREVLDARGVPVVEVPCVETAWRAWPWSSPALDVTFFTSRRAVEAWVRAGRPPLHEVVAVSPSTSGALRALDVVPVLEVEGGVVALAEHLAARWDVLGRPPTQVRYPTSSAGPGSAEQERALQVLAQLGEVDRRVVYDVRAPPGLEAALEAATQFSWSATFASPSAVSHFFAALDAPRPPHHVVCLGQSTARAWNELRPPAWPVAIPSRDLKSTLQEVTP